jgi:pyruvate kinase
MNYYRIHFLSGTRKFVDVDAACIDEAIEKVIDSLHLSGDTAVGDFELELLATTQ